MTAQDSRPGGPGARFLVAAASFVVVVAGLRAATQLILPFLVSVFLAIISLPLLNWLHRKKVPPPLAILLTVMAAVAVMAVMVLVVRQSVNEFAEVAPGYQARLQELVTSVVDGAQGLGQGLGIETSGLDDFINPGVALDLMGGTLGAVAGLLSNTFLNTFLVLLTVIFILLEAAGFSRKLSAAFGDDRVHLQPFERITRQVQNYLAIKTLVSLATGVTAGVLVWALGLDFPLLWGLLAFIFNYIPNLGSVLAGVPPVLLAILQLGPGRALAVALGYLVINTVFGNFIEPTLMGRRLGLSTLVVFLSLVFWGWVWGPVGMLLAVPLTMVIKIALENTGDFHWVAVMLDANPASTPPPRAQGS